METPTDRFDVCFGYIFQFEGGYANHPADRGGATKFGITQKTLDDWCAGLGMPSYDVRDLSKAGAADIYRLKYWDVCRCDELPPPIDLVVFDLAVNHGQKHAAKFLQSALGGLVVDGVIGEKTLAAANKAPTGAKCIASNILYGRSSFYQNIVARDQTQRVFLNGWLNRIAELRKMI